MGNYSSKVSENNKRKLTVIGGTSLVLIGGFVYYRWYNYNRILNADLDDADLDKEFEDDFIEKFTEMEQLDNTEKCQGGKENVTYISADHEKRSRQESIVYTNDRRQKIISPNDNRAIIKCIGRIKSWNYGNEDDAKYATGTVFRSLRSTIKKKVFFFVVTCAHSIVDDNDKRFDRIQFHRIESLNDRYGGHKYKVKQKYDLYASNVYEGKNDNEEKTVEDDIFPTRNDYSYDENDLAILVFEDDKLYYRQIFVANGKNVVSLLCANQLPRHVILRYSLYGFPVCRDSDDPDKGERYFKVGELWGMTSKSLVSEDESVSGNIEYVQRDGPMFVYNAIDTEPGQSGSAIFLSFKDNKYVIVGVHVKGVVKMKHNRGVALTKDIINQLMPKNWKHPDTNV